MTRAIFSRILRLLPAVLVPGLLFHFHPLLGAELQGPGTFWEIVLALLAIAGFFVGMLFSQWRASAGLVLIAVLYLLFQGPGIETESGLSQLAILLSLLTLGIIALLPERGPMGPAPTLTGILVLVIAALELRGVEITPPVDLALAVLPGPGTLTLNIPSLLALVVAVIIVVTQLWRPQAVRAALLAALLCMLPLTQTEPTRSEQLILGGAGLLLIWLGLILHAWRMAFVDELTGLPNRRALELRLGRERRPLAMVDVDHFKRFNDRWGHDAGDQVLRRVADLLTRTGRGVKAYRYGGEEFTLVLPRQSSDRLKTLLDKTRQAITDTPFRLRGVERNPKQRGQGGGKAIRISASFGLAMPRKGEISHDILKRADKALYRAKNNGRNRVETSE